MIAEREPEHRRDLERAQPGPNVMGAERYTITKHSYIKDEAGNVATMVEVLERNQPIGARK